MSYDFVSGDTGSTLVVTCKDPTGKVIDLTLQSVKLRWQDKDLTYKLRDMSVSNPTSGVASYQFQAGELEAGKMRFEVQMVDPSTSFITSTNIIEAQVRGHL